MNTHTYRLCIAIIALQFGAFLVGKAPINITQHPALPIPMSPAIIKIAQLRKDLHQVKKESETMRTTVIRLEIAELFGISNQELNTQGEILRERMPILLKRRDDLVLLIDTVLK